MLDVDGKGIMFEGHSDDVVCEIDAGEKFGRD
jgi:hypothetical protein